MDKVISRRDFIVGGGVFGASMAAVGLAGCAPSNAGLPSTDTDASGTSTHKGADRPLSSHGGVRCRSVRLRIRWNLCRH